MDRFECPDLGVPQKALPGIDSVDMATCQTLLMHCRDPATVAREMVRIVRPGGALSRPWLWGIAINSLLMANINGLYLAAGQHVLSVAFGTIRRRCDTRTFSRIHARLAADVVLDQHARNVDISYIAARARLSRELVDFLERDLYSLVQGVFYLLGAAIAIRSIDAINIPRLIEQASKIRDAIRRLR